MPLFGPRIKAALNPGSITGASDVETVTYIRSILSRTRRTQSALETHSPAERNSRVNEERFSALHANGYPLLLRPGFSLELYPPCPPDAPHHTSPFRHSPP